MDTNLTAAFLLCPGGLSAFHQAGRRQDHQCRLDRRRSWRSPVGVAYCAVQGRHRPTLQGARGRLGKGQHPGQLDPAWLDRHAAFGQVAGRNPRPRGHGLGRTPAGRWGAPEDFAGAAVFFASAVVRLRQWRLARHRRRIFLQGLGFRSVVRALTSAPDATARSTSPKNAPVGSARCFVVRMDPSVFFHLAPRAGVAWHRASRDARNASPFRALPFSPNEIRPESIGARTGYQRLFAMGWNLGCRQSNPFGRRRSNRIHADLK